MKPHRLARINVVPIDFGICRLGQDRVAGQFRAVVANDRLGLAMAYDEKIELTGNQLVREREVGDRDQALPGADVVDRQNAESAPADELIGDEVQCPQIIRLRRAGHRGPGAQGPLAGRILASAG